MFAKKSESALKFILTVSSARGPFPARFQV